MTVSILGTECEIIKKKYADDPDFERSDIDGYCDTHSKLIVHCDMTTYPGWQTEPPETIRRNEQNTLRHEIIHAFLAESGLAENSLKLTAGWATNEEMVDWFALQGGKIHETWKAAGAID